MRLIINNTGKISHADIEINAITTIAGENNTGKSTVGKILYCMFNSFYNIKKQITRERQNSISNLFIMFYDSVYIEHESYSYADEFIDAVFENLSIYTENKILLENDLWDFFVKNGLLERYPEIESHIPNIVNKIFQILNITNNEILSTVFHKLLNVEFKMQINNIYQPNSVSEVVMQIKNVEIKALIRENNSIEIENDINLNTEAIYMDDPLILDNMRNKLRMSYAYVDHRGHLQKKIVQNRDDSTVKQAMEEIITSKKLDLILEKLNNVCKGRIVNSKSMLSYKESDSDTPIDIANISTGLKTFVILKTLLLKGSLEENGVLILDEPEIHLHPEWQIIFAELIVLIQKEFNLHILINTHSPYFLDAIDVFSHKHGISGKCKYYLAENSGKSAIITDVSSNIEKIYAKLSRPLQVLENERYQNG